MTDEQWLWLFVNEAIDYDEKMERMCDRCQDEVTSNRCIRCGKLLGGKKSAPFNAQFVNPNFDPEKFEALSNGTDDSEQGPPHDDDIDYELFEAIAKHDEGEEQS